MKTYHKFLTPEQSIGFGIQYLSNVLLVIFLAAMNLSVSAQEEKSTTVLIAPASQADKSGLSDSSTSKLTRMEQSGTYGLILLVKVGNLAKIQKNGVLTFNIPGSGESLTYKATKVIAYSESDFTWSGSSANGEASFICKNGVLSGAFRFNKKFFELYNIEGEFYVLSHIRTDLEINCDTEGGAYRSDENKVNDTPSGQGKSARKGVCTEPMRVLVLYTQNAANSVSNINGVIDQSIQQYNNARTALDGISPLVTTKGS